MKKQVIEQLQNTLEWVMQEWINTKQELAEVRIELEETIKLHTIEENQFNDSYEDLMWLYVKQRTELEDTIDSRDRCRNQLESYKMFESLFVATGEKLTLYYNKSKEYENMSVWKFMIKKFK